MGNTLIGLSPRMREALSGGSTSDLATGVNSLINGKVSFYINGVYTTSPFTIPSANMNETRTYEFEAYTNLDELNNTKEPVSLTWFDGSMEFQKVISSASGTATITINGVDIGTSSTEAFMRDGKMTVEISASGSWVEGDQIALQITHAAIPAGNVFATTGSPLTSLVEIVGA